MLYNGKYILSALAATAVLFISISAAEAADSPAENRLKIMSGYPPLGDNLVTLRNWREPPYNRWSYQNVEKLLPTTTIYRGTGPIRQLEKASSEIIGKYEAAVDSDKFDLDAYIAANYIDGLIVLKDGKLVAEHYANNQTIDTRHIVNSVGKSFTGLIAEWLVYEGVLDEVKLVEDYIPELSESGFSGATVRQVMDQLVDPDYDEDTTNPRSEVSMFIYAGGWQKPPKGVTAYPGVYKFLPSIGKGGEPGRKWHYVSATTEVLGWLIARAANKTWVDIFAERVYPLLGARRDAYVIVDGQLTPAGAGGINISLRDNARFAQMILNDGRVGNKQIIPAEVIRRIKAGGDPKMFMPDDPSISYRSQWYIDTQQQQLYARGYAGQFIEIGMESGLVIVTHSSTKISRAEEYEQRRKQYRLVVEDALSE